MGCHNAHEPCLDQATLLYFISSQPSVLTYIPICSMAVSPFKWWLSLHPLVNNGEFNSVYSTQVPPAKHLEVPATGAAGYLYGELYRHLKDNPTKSDKHMIQYMLWCCPNTVSSGDIELLFYVFLFVILVDILLYAITLWLFVLFPTCQVRVVCFDKRW